MCSSKAEGGNRCFGHANRDYKTAAAAVAGATTPADVEKAEERYEKRVAELAANDKGLLHLRRRASAIEAGDTLAGDDLTVLRRYAPPKMPSDTTVALAEALMTGNPVREVAKPQQPVVVVPRSAGPFALDLDEALAYGKPMAPEARATKTVAPSREWDDNAFAAALRGERTPFGETRPGGFPDGVDENGSSLLA